MKGIPGRLAQGFKTLMIAVGVGALGWSSSQARGDEIALTWHGQATTVLQTAGDLLLIDAFFVQSASIAALPTRAGVEARHGGILKLILLTHGHADHFGVALNLLEAGSAPSCTPGPPVEPLLPLLAANSELIRNLVALKLVGDPCRVVDWNIGGKLTPGRVIQLGQLVPPLSGTFPAIGDISEITMVPAEHSSSLTDAEGIARNGGEAIGYIIRFKNGFTLYHAGDTYVFDEMRTLGERYDIDLAVLPIGGNFTMDPVDAAFAAVKLLKPRFVIPVHYAAGSQRPFGFSPALVGTPEEFIKAIGPRRDIEVIVPQRGDTVIFRGAGRSATADVLRVE